MSNYPTGISTPAQGRIGGVDRPPPRTPRKKKKKQKPFVPTIGQPFPVTDPRLILPAPGTAAQIARDRRRRREILRRQRILAGSGYKIVVDGTWGPRSQRAWLHYQKHRSIVTIKKPQDNLDLTVPQAAPTPRQTTETIVREKRLAEQAEARRRAKQQEENRRQAILKRAAMLRSDPSKAQYLNIRQLTDVLVDPEVDYDPVKNKNLTRSIQFFLRGQGYKVNTNGILGRNTVQAWKKAGKAAIRKEKNEQVNFIRERLFDSGLVKEGDRPNWFATWGAIPSPEKLLKTLQTGGFMVDQMFIALLNQAISPDLSWTQVRAVQLNEIVQGRTAWSQEGLMPGGTSAMLANVIGAENVPLYQYMFDIWAVSDLAPFGDYSEAAGYNEDERKFLLQARSKDQWIRDENLKRRGGLRSEVGALLQANNPQEIAGKFLAIAKAEEAKYEQFRLKIASQDSGWFGATTNALAWPSEVMTESIVAAAMTIGTAASRYEGMNVSATLRGQGGEIVPATREEAKKELENWNPVLKFSFELAADPLNFVAPLRLASTGAALLSLNRSARFGRYVLTGSGGAKLIRYQKGTWTLGRSVGVATKATGKGYITLVAGREFAEKTSEVLRRMSQTNNEMLGSVSKRLRQSSRFGWKPPTYTIGDGRDFVVPEYGSPDAKRLMDANDREFGQFFTKSKVFRVLVDELKRTGGSLHVDHNRMNLSQYGTALNAHLMANMEAMVVARISMDYADDVYDRVLYSQIEDTGKILDELDEAQLDAFRQKAFTDAQNTYHDTIRSFGSHLAGGPDQKLYEMRLRSKIPVEEPNPNVSRFVLEKNGQNLVERKNAEMALLSEKVEKTIIAPLQDELERFFNEALESNIARASRLGVKEAGDHPLWDKDGNWRNADSEDVKFLVDKIRKSFDEDSLDWVENPQFGRSYTDVSMRAAVRDELGRRLRRINDYAARKIASNALSEQDKHFAALAHNEREAAIEKDIFDSWEKKDDGLFYDTRERVQVSRLYARTFDELAAKELVVDENGELHMLASLGIFQPDDTMTKLEHDLRNLSAMLSGIYPKRLPGTEYRLPGVPKELQEEQKLLEDLIDKRMIALGKFEETAVSKMMLEHGAVWRAWQHAQGRKAQLAYKGLSTHLMLWKFATLALRPAWAMRNFIDNVAKAIIAGCRDPRLFIVGPGQAVGHALAQDLNVVRDFMTVMDTMFGTSVGKYFNDILDLFWEIPSKTLSRIFKDVMIEVPPEVFEMGLRQDIINGKALGLRTTTQPTPQRVAELTGIEYVPPGTVEKAVESLEHVGKRFGEIAFHIVGNIPENYARRLVYRNAYKKAQRKFAGDPSLTSVQVNLKSTDEAIKAVEDTLFDYSKISVIEDNLKVFFPFIQFWRKNSTFWAKSFATKPWLLPAVAIFDDNRREAHKDQPEWMKRYFHTDEIVDALAVVPGLDDFFEAAGLDGGAMFDPLSLSSMAPFYRAFKGENQFLPGESPGVPYLASLIDGVNDFGLGMNPLFRKPLELTGVANKRSWQNMFPQTSMALAFADATDSGELAFMANTLEFVGTMGISGLEKLGPDEVAQNKDYWIQTVVAEQVVRGETPDLKKAEKMVESWFVAMNLWGYFGGIYWRRATPEDMYLASMQDDIIKGDQSYDSLTSAQKEQLRIWGMRGMDRITYDRYIGLMPVIKAYYKGDLEAKDEIKQANPEIIRWVDGDFTGRPVSTKFVRHTARYVEQDRFFAAMEIADSLDVSDDVRDAVEDYFLSPELKKFWTDNATPSRTRDRMIQAEVNEYLNGLREGYFAIPESDYETRDAYIDDHPELIRHFNQNNDPVEDYDAVFGHIKADLRDTYFSIVQAHGGDDKGFQAAADFLKLYPFMFEGTKAEKKIKDGEWIAGGGRGGRKWSAERIADFRAAKPHLTWFFDTFLPKVGAKQAFKWLNETDTPNGIAVRDYLNKYPSTKRLDYLKAAPHLKIYFGMPPAERGAWLRSGSEASKIVLGFFKKYGEGQSKHSVDYLAAKKDLDYYFSLPETTRSKWLDSDDPRAKKVKDYFKKYGKNHQFERSFKKLIKAYPNLAHGTPEQALRMRFWKQYFELPVDKRPLFVLEEAEKHGIFIYGEFGEKYNHDREQEFMRRAVGIDISERAAAYLYVRPLLKFYRTLNPDQKELFAKANPELQWYFDNFTHKSMTGNKKLDKLVERYFSLPADSPGRSAFLRKHPEVQDWFDKRSTPAERAIRNVLEQYFNLAPIEKPGFLIEHPEIQIYFDARKIEKENEREQLEAFDFADPRLAPFYETASDLERAAYRMRQKLSDRVLKAYEVTTRRDRRAA